MYDFSSVLTAFQQELKRRQVRLHGAVLMQDAKIIRQIYQEPYTEHTKTRMYSASKSVTAVAIGKLIGEGKLSMDDKIVDIFADRFDMSKADPLLKEQTIRHMLTMVTCYSQPTYDEHRADWLASYFSSRATHPCGTVWHYDSCGTYTLGAVVKHLTGKDFAEYLRPEFDVIGVSQGVYCMQGPDGEAWASSALIATTSDLARIAYLLLNKGRWGDRQLLPEEFAVNAISPLVRVDDGGRKITRYDYGYGYQIWSHPNGAFAFRGLGGQLAIGFPDRDLVFACNADTSGNLDYYDDIFEAVDQIILPAFPVKNAAILPQPVVQTVFESICNQKYLLNENPMGLRSVEFSGTEKDMVLTYERDSGRYQLRLSTEKEVRQEFPQAYTGTWLFHPQYRMHYQCSAESRWLTPRQLYVRVWAEDVYVGNMAMCFFFREDGKITVKMNKYAQFYFDDFQGIAWGEVQSCKLSL